jgi:hypothetical protein
MPFIPSSCLAPPAFTTCQRHDLGAGLPKSVWNGSNTFALSYTKGDRNFGLFVIRSSASLNHVGSRSASQPPGPALS